ncbi:major facilitator superfamily domain-containing protein [Infundibulicybe gibba]|nr:major facilitator superfamily domain-containing protein [Infundibulicybe gibba]
MPPSHESALVSQGLESTGSDAPSDAVEKGRARNNVVFVDGGLRAWMTVLGCWFILFSTLGYLYSFGVYQDFYTRVYLKSRVPAVSRSWMGSVQLAMPFAGGIVAGRLFDAGYFHHIMILGSLIFMFSLFMLSLAHEERYYQIFLSQGLGVGIGAGLVYAPATTVLTLHFKRRRALAYGVSLTGVSLGAVVFPIPRNPDSNSSHSHLFARMSFGSAVRVSAYIALGCLILGNMLVRTPTQRNLAKRPPPQMRKYLRDAPYAFFIAGPLHFLRSDIVIFSLVVYLQLYAVEHDVDNTLAFYSLAILNGAGIIGRIAANHMADTYGVWNIQVPTTLFTTATIWAILGINSVASLIVVSILYGVFSGAWLSLTVAGLASLSIGEEVGARVGVALAIASVGLLVSAPIQGALLTSKFLWIRPIAFSGSFMFLATILYAITRTLLVKKKKTQRV